MELVQRCVRETPPWTAFRASRRVITSTLLQLLGLRSAVKIAAHAQMALPLWLLVSAVPYAKWTVPKIVLPVRRAIISAPLHRWACRHALTTPAHAPMESPPSRLEPPEQLYVKSILWLIALHVRLDTA